MYTQNQKRQNVVYCASAFYLLFIAVIFWGVLLVLIKKNPTYFDRHKWISGAYFRDVFSMNILCVLDGYQPNRIIFFLSDYLSLSYSIMFTFICKWFFARVTKNKTHFHFGCVETTEFLNHRKNIKISWKMVIRGKNHYINIAESKTSRV